jgi:trk system potassium uptake protein TrkA
MKAIIIGAGEVGVMVAKTLLSRGQDVVIVEKERTVIDGLYDELDCSFIHGDGTRPAILKEADPASADVLFSITKLDQSNIIASLVGRSLGVRRVVTSIENPEFESVCLELGLEHTVVPPRTIARYLADMVEDVDVPELSTFVRGEGRFFMFAVSDGEAGTTVADLELPTDARAVCLYREGKFRLADAGTTLDAGDEVVVLTHARNLPALHERFQPANVTENDSESARGRG